MKGSNKMLSIIVAKAKNNIIGKNNQLIWRLPAESKKFKELTDGKIVIMGRKTYETLGKFLRERKKVVYGQRPFWSKAFILHHPGGYPDIFFGDQRPVPVSGCGSCGRQGEPLRDLCPGSGKVLWERGIPEYTGSRRGKPSSLERWKTEDGKT